MQTTTQNFMIRAYCSVLGLPFFRDLTAVFLLPFLCLLAPFNSWGGGGKQLSELLVVPGEYKCPVCLDGVQKPVASCASRHVMCQDCIKRWQQQVGANCPLCRGQLLRQSFPVVREPQLPAFLPIPSDTAFTSWDYLRLPYWWRQKYGYKVFDVKLYEGFSGLFQGKDQDEPPTQEQIAQFMDWDIWWQNEGDTKILGRELLICFFAIFRDKGLPKKQVVEDYLQRELWWQGDGEERTLDWELFCTFSSIFNGKGLPEKQTVDDYLQLDVWWQEDGGIRTLDRKLFHTFSLMFSGRGLPDKKTVEDYEYTINGPTLTLWPHGATEPITLPTPDLKWHPDGVKIRHWTSADLHRFYQATECLSGNYQEPSESNESESDVIAAQLVKRHRNRTVDVEQQEKPPVPYLSVAMLRGIVKNRVPMNAVAWASADYHKDTLSPSLLAQLKERANADNDGLVPDSLKMFLSERDQPSQIAPIDLSRSLPNSPATWLETVLRQSVLSAADINQLYTYRDQLTSDQVVDIWFRMDQRVSQDTMQRWQRLLGDKHQQTLNAHPPWLDGSDQTMEAMHDIEDILRELFPDALL